MAGIGHESAEDPSLPLELLRIGRAPRVPFETQIAERQPGDREWLLGRPPADRILRHELDVGGEDPPAAERPHQSLPVAPFVDRLHLRIGRHQGAEILPQEHVDRRAVVDRANTHREELRRHLAGFFRDRLQERVPQRHLAEIVGIEPRDPHQPRRLASRDRHEGLEHGRHEDRSQVVRIEGRIVGHRIGRRPGQAIGIEGLDAIDIDPRPECLRPRAR